MRLLICMLALLVGACASVDTATIASGPRYTDQQMDENYPLGVGDKVRLTVYREENLSGEFPVGPAGTISVPLIGTVPVTGESADAVAEAIRMRLADGYLKDPRVNVELVQLRPYFILGEVSDPGRYEYASGLTALNAIATAGGFTPRSEKRVLYIRAAGTEGEQAYRLTADLRIRPGDTLRVGERLF
ncbi:polysaccharide biosynthesis/export family protein [Croceibacterium sp. TMG7-5b_MA50]|uniref:polysaccharide biosynthesis/export family protein n=1 Tax=Croceibacterium sp. TMG7-5b_MA50 TaxID=3121290 RepID=UPI0032217F1E